MEGLVLKYQTGGNRQRHEKPLVEGLVLKLPVLVIAFARSEAPRGGAGIEIGRMRHSDFRTWKPLVEGLVLKFCRCGIQHARCEAPRGGAGIEMNINDSVGSLLQKPLVEGLVLKSAGGRIRG